MGGGHAAGTGRRGTTEFPPHWNGGRILVHIADVANRPDEPVRKQRNGRWRAVGVREEVTIVVIVDQDGQVRTGFPIAGPGVIRNPDTAADPANPTVADLVESRVSYYADAVLTLLTRHLPAEELAHYRSLYLGGEWEELLDELAAYLFAERPPLTPDEFADVERLLDAYDIPVPGFEFLNDREHILRTLREG